MNRKLNRTAIAPRIAISALALSALALCLVLLVPSLPAQAPASGQPGRAARLSYVDGKVQLSQGGQVLASQAVINAPLFEGTQIVTAEEGKAEIQFDDGSVARLSPNSALTLKTLTGEGAAGQTEIVLDRGLAYFELQGSDQSGQMRVLFADNAVTASGFSVIRVDMDNPPGAMAVFSGNAHVERASGSSLDLHGGQSAEFNGANPASPDVADAIQPDSWDAWNSDRDQALGAEASTQTPATSELAGSNAANPAWSDLDASGNWYNVPDQGYVWSPYDAANSGFDPYGNGAWVATPGYGYAWASGYSWGYLPYQCGAWNYYNDFGWGWAPGIGGCSPWWGIGFYPGPRFGILPIGYRPIHRPILGHGPFTPGHAIPVNRTPFIARAGLASRPAVVTIAGHPVEAMHAVPVQSAFARGPMSATARIATPRSAYVGGRAVYAPAPAYRPAPANPPRGYTPQSHPAPAPRSYYAPSRPSGGGSVPRPSGGGSAGGHAGSGAHR